MRLMIVEDSQKINDLLAMFSRQEGHSVTQAFSAEEAIFTLSKSTFDVIITDLMMPGIQGEEFIRLVRKISDVYIIVISAKIEIHEKLDVLSIGADDYITKPFSVEEIIAKLKNIQKRISYDKPTLRSYNQGVLRILPIQREVLLHGEAVSLTKYEYDLLWYLATHPKRIFTRDELIEICFSDSEAFDRVIDAYIKNIRKTIKDEANNPQFIKTHYGVGYQFVGEADD